MVGGNTRRPDVERPRKTSLFNRGPNRITLTSERLAPLRKRSKCYVAKIAYGTITFCATAILIIWMLHGSLCEIRMSFWGAEFAAFLQCKQ
ncbi:Hok/Gef family protein [Escherichia coli]|nr:Hok/Gef family protein [Escherichia coli]